MKRRRIVKRRFFFVILVVFLLIGLVWKFAFNNIRVGNVANKQDVKINNISAKSIEDARKQNHENFIETAINKQISLMKSVEEEEKRRIEEKIKNNTFFVRKNNTKLYEEPQGTLKEITLDSKTKIFVSQRVDKDIVKDGEVTSQKQWCYIKPSYESSEFLGWVQADAITQDRAEFIDKPYKGVDYSYFEKVDEYPDNPRVEVKGIYVTGYAAASDKFDRLLELADRTAINAFVIDVRDDNEVMLFDSPTAQKYSPSANKKPYIKDMSLFMEKLAEHNIYPIARIVTFKTPKYAKSNPDKAISRRETGELYKSRDGVRWSSPYDRDLWEYNIGVAKEAAKYGFREIQFDYVRFPASGGGKLDSSLDYHNVLNETKPEAIQKFLKQAYAELSKQQVYVSADVFGWVASAITDVGIGQHWEGLTAVTDYMCPMMYPSHYGAGNYGLSVPDAFPYETIDRGVKDALDRDSNVESPAMLRPWIQDFTAGWVKGHIKYGPAQIDAQIRALEDNGIYEYLLWNAANVYTEAGIR